MKRAKTTRRALVMSLLSLLLCCSMLVGTTFAWFTDSVTSGKNKIIAGNLDVELYYKLNAKDDWAKVTSETELFDDAALWEPGYTQVVYLKVANEGTLALKYQLGVNIISETQGKNVDGDMFKLSDYIEFDAIETEEEKTYADRKAAREAVTEAQIISAGYGKASQLLATEDEFVTLVVYMPEETDNKANYRDIKPEITLGLNLVATQLEAETDSFGTDYDKNAAYIPAWDGTVTTPKKSADGVYHITTAAELAGLNNVIVAQPAEAPIKVSLDADLNLDNQPWSPIGVEKKEFVGTFEGNGHTIYNVFVNTSGNSGEVGDSGLFGSIKNYATIKNLKLENVTVNLANGERVGTLAGKVQTSTVENCSVNNATVVGKSKVGGLIGDIVSSKVNNCSVSNATVIGEERTGGIAGRIRKDDGSSALTNSKVSDTIVYATAAETAEYFVGQNVVNADLSTNTYSNVTLIKNTPAYTIGSAEELAALGGTKINGTYILLADIDMASTAMQPMEISGGASVTFEGNGYTISNLTLGAAGIHGMTGSGNEVAGLFDLTAPATTVSLTVNDLTVKDATVECSGYAAAIVGYNPNGGTVINLNNVDVDGATVTSDSVAALVGYTTGNVNLNGCDVSGLSLTGEEGRPEKVGAYIGTANTATCAVTVADCTNNTTYRDYGRVINGATWNGAKVYTTTEAAQAALDAAQPGDVIALTGEFETLTIKNFWGGDYTQTGITPITIKSTTGAKVGAIDLNGMNFVTIEGITFDSAKAVQVYAGGPSGDYGSIVDSANDESKSRGANHITIKDCIFTGTPAVEIGKYCPINFMGSNPSSWTYNITVSGCKFLTNAQNFIRMNNVTNNGSVLIEGNTFGGEAYTTNHHAINASANGGDWTITGNTFINWNPKKCAFATGRSAAEGITDFVITGNIFSNTRIPTAADGDDGVIEIKTNSYTTTNQTLDFSGNTFAGALAGLDETTVKYVKP